jgi:hypothetical protein
LLPACEVGWFVKRATLLVSWLACQLRQLICKVDFLINVPTYLQSGILDAEVGTVTFYGTEGR